MKSHKYFLSVYVIFFLINTCLITVNSNKIKTSSAAASGSKSEAKTESKTEAKSESKSLTKTDNKLNLKLTTKMCNPICKECSENDSNFCTACVFDALFYEYNCYRKCPEGTFKEDGANECIKCSGKCPICWGPDTDMCGSNLGVKTLVVILEREVVNFFNSYTFTRREIDEWINSLKVILSRENEEKMFLNGLIVDKFSTNEVYDAQRAEVDLPIGSFSKFNGIFVPVPSYLNDNKELVNSHWIYKKGMWEGHKWVLQYFPRLPKFIKKRGERNRIYYENGGFWAWDQMKDWYWIKAANLKESFDTVPDTLAMLNTVKVDLGDYNRRKLKENQEIKKLTLQNNVKNFFDNLMHTDKIIFTEMKHTFNEEQNNLINTLDRLKAQVSTIFGEDLLTTPQKTEEDEEKKKMNDPHTIDLNLFNTDEDPNSRFSYSKEKMQIVDKLIKTISKLED